MKSTLQPGVLQVLDKEFAANLKLRCQIELASGKLDVLTSDAPSLLVGVVELKCDMSDLFCVHRAAVDLLDWKESVEHTSKGAIKSACRVEACIVSPVPPEKLPRTIVTVIRALGVHVIALGQPVPSTV